MSRGVAPFAAFSQSAKSQVPTDAPVRPESAPRLTLWTAHAAVWMMGILAARLSRTGSMLELHITGRNGAELAPDHVRQILTAPTTEFKAISLVGVLASVALALALWRQSPRAVRAVTLLVAAGCLLIYFAGYGIG